MQAAGNFSETVSVAGQNVPRFQRLEPSRAKNEAGAQNYFDELPKHLPGEIVQTLVEATDVRIERIVSYGHASPADFWYDQDQNEWVTVLKGEARLGRLARWNLGVQSVWPITLRSDAAPNALD